MKITRLTIYPVKSFKGIDLDQAMLFDEGLAWDRRWMLVDEQQSFVTQRRIPELATLSVALTDRALVLSHPDAGSFEISLEEPKTRPYRVKVWGDHCKARPESEEVTRWLVKVLGEQAKGLRMVRFASEFERPVEPDYLDGATASTHFADGYPMTIGCTASLEALNKALRDRQQLPVPMERFRPNVVIDSSVAWAENGWKMLGIGRDDIRLASRKPCKRCKIVTIDQQTSTSPEPKEPLATLVKLNTQPTLKGAYFGQNVTVSKGQGATISVGDEVRVLEEQ